MAPSGRDEPVRKRRRLEESDCSPKINFKSLPPEVRLMIWEYTWPAAQVVEAASRDKFDDDDSDDDNDNDDDDDDNDDNYHDFTIFRPLSSLDTLLQLDFTSRPVETPSPLEKCSSPIALQICQESRWHTLKTYVLIQHLDLPEWSFYFNPRQDLLWLSGDIASDTKRLKQLQSSYQASIHHFKTLLVEDTEWEGWEWDPSSSPALSILPALRTVVLVEDDHDDDGTLITYYVEEYQERAMEYGNDYYTACESMKSDMPYRIEYMDRGGNSYFGVYVPHRMIDAGRGLLDSEDPMIAGNGAQAEGRSHLNGPSMEPTITKRLKRPELRSPEYPMTSSWTMPRNAC
ncbi:hypothetical protein PMAA_102690 [Talaromyces marneffei ATCC 18224]|nr:hypothetical protein PMAA_102690 [Talaromyces marneffei ATCC 18224]